MPDKVFFDTNILVYAHDSSSSSKKNVSQELKPLSAAQARKEILLLSNMATVDIDPTLVVRAIEIHEKWQLSYWDALILASAERAGCSTVYSEDLSDGQSYGAVTVRNPYKQLLSIS